MSIPKMHRRNISLCKITPRTHNRRYKRIDVIPAWNIPETNRSKISRYLAKKRKSATGSADNKIKKDERTNKTRRTGTEAGMHCHGVYITMPDTLTHVQMLRLWPWYGNLAQIKLPAFTSPSNVWSWKERLKSSPKESFPPSESYRVLRISFCVQRTVYCA